MLFHIWVNENRYEECKKVRGIRIDRRTTDAPEKILCYKGNKIKADRDWYGKGRNHRVVDGMIERDFDDEFFIIEINTIEDLLDFQDKYKVTASISRDKSQHVFNGVELYSFYEDYIME